MVKIKKVKLDKTMPPKGAIQVSDGTAFISIAVEVDGEVLKANSTTQTGVEWLPDEEGSGSGLSQPQVMARSLGC